MIALVHNNKQVVNVFDATTEEVIGVQGTIVEVFFKLAEKFPNEKIVWCHKKLVPHLSIDALGEVMDIPFKMCSFETSNEYFMNTSIGFVEQTLFINVSKEVTYPTWLMSSDVGVITADVLVNFKGLLKYKLSFEELLNYIAKKGINNGLLCYSIPLLLKDGFPIISKKRISNSQLFRFVKSNYKYRWVWLYLLNKLVYNKKLLLLSFLNSIFKSKIDINISIEQLKSVGSIDKYPTIDVLIPTLGRENYLKDVLLDLSKQTILPTRIIIVEQQPIENSSSTLDFLNEKWPFEIDHTLIYQLGACNARNIGLTKVQSEWTFFADDDIRMETGFLEQSFKYIQYYKARGVTLSCLREGEVEKLDKIIQWNSFGSGCSIVKSEYLKELQFDMALEFGYGEDFDFGMQLRKRGVDILYIPFVKMLHLKAPIGGFRKKIEKEWEQEQLLPKPSPTVMVVKLKHSLIEQIQGYKTNLFLKFYRSQAIKNPFKYYSYFKKAWNKSVYWTNELMKN